MFENNKQPYISKASLKYLEVIFMLTFFSTIILVPLFYLFGVFPTTKLNTSDWELVSEDIGERAQDFNYSLNKINSKEALNQYYLVYQDPYVIHIRKVLDGYLEGKQFGMGNAKMVIKKQEIYGSVAGLSAFDKSYYRSKFIVYDMGDVPSGGKQIRLIFQDKPDHVFDVWVKKISGDIYDLKAFWQNDNFKNKEMEVIGKLYANFLNDPVHSL